MFWETKYPFSSIPSYHVARCFCVIGETSYYHYQLSHSLVFVWCFGETRTPSVSLPIIPNSVFVWCFGETGYYHYQLSHSFVFV